MNKKILVINQVNGNKTTIIANLTLNEAKAGQRAISQKMPEGTGTVIISESVTVEEFLKTLG